ncbi:MAG: sulfatase-like hydrolase/transferase [Verrucomicrobium sp.]
MKKVSMILAVSFAVTGWGECQETAGSNRPNIVLVMADDQGWGDMAYNGHPKLKTPNFDALAQEGIRFDNFHAAAPVCSPTRGSVMTGRTPNRFGCFSWGHTLRPQEVTLAEALKPAGYRTGHFGKWHLGSVQKDSPVNPGNSGFDEWVSAPNFFDLNPVLSDQGKAVEFEGDSSDVTVDLALKFIRKNAEAKQPFFAVVWFGSPHSPHQALEADRVPYADLPPAQQNFLGEITAMDRAFGRLRQEIKDLGVRDNTILWYCSDNGALPKVGSSGGRRGNKGTVYEGGLLVPALLEWPARFASPKVVTLPCVTSDIYPTLLDVADVTVPNQPTLDGVSLLGLISGREKEREQPIGFWDRGKKGVQTPSKKWMDELLAAQKDGREPNDPERLNKDAAVIGEPVPLNQFPGHAAWLDGAWKLHRIEDPKTHEVEWELYNLEADPNETRVLFAEQPDRMPAMQEALDAWLKSVAKSLNGDDYPKAP